MRWQALALVSVVGNAVLVTALLSTGKSRHKALPGTAQAAATETASSAASPPAQVIRRQFFTWHEVESPDYAVYMANLRDIGCPPATIRDIIIADVNSLYAKREAQEVVTASQQWWLSQPDTNLLAVAARKRQALDQERRALLTRLLGADWEDEATHSPFQKPTRPKLALDGPVLGDLAADKKQSLEDAHNKLLQKLRDYVEAQKRDGKPLDAADIAKLRQQERYELAKILSPAQLEEYLLRYAPNAEGLRREFGQLKYFNATPDEFRAVFRAADPFDQQYNMLGDAQDQNSVDGRRALLDRRENAIKLALGPQRYEQYILLHDPAYRDAVATAIEAGTPDAVMQLYQINQAAAQQQEQIQADASLTAAQKNIQLKQLEAQQLTANTIATGGEPPPDQNAPTQPQGPVRRTYTLRQGDSPAVIAMIYGVPESAIRAANPGLNFSSLRPGDSVNIPRNALMPVTAPLVGPSPAVIPTSPR